MNQSLQSPLPHPIAAYVEAANAQASDLVAACFHPDATVADEGGVHRGRADIAAWAADTAQRYRFTIEPAGLEEADSQHRLTAKVRGDFPGSPVALRFDFVLDAGSIRALEIRS